MRAQPASLFTPTHRCPACGALEANPGPVISFPTADGADRVEVVFCFRCLLGRMRALGIPEMAPLTPAEFDTLDAEYRKQRQAFADRTFAPLAMMRIVDELAPFTEQDARDLLERAAHAAHQEPA